MTRFEVLNDSGTWYVFDHGRKERLARDYDSYAAAFNIARSMNQGYMVPLRSDYPSPQRAMVEVAQEEQADRAVWSRLLGEVFSD